MAKTFTNLVSNALFASETNWSGYNSISGGVMTKTGSSWALAGSTAAISDVSGRKYYIAANCRVSNVARDTRLGLGSLSGGSGVFEAYNLVKDSSSFVRTSAIRTSGATQSAYIAVYIPDGTSTTIECNGMLYIDLTTLFGAGNEPTQSWCDANIPFFNGTQDLSSPSLSPSSSISPSSSRSPSASQSPSSSSSRSISPSASTSPSSSSSRSVSPSASRSPSSSSSRSISPSASRSPSSSFSASVSPSSSNSPSPSAGFENYTRESVAVLPATDNDLTTPYSGQDLTDVSSINSVYVAQEGSGSFIIHQFKNFVGSLTFCMLQFSGKADFSPASSPVLLQIFNQQTDAWETVATQNTVGAGTDFTFDEYIADLTDYKTPENTISCRVWQELG